MFSTAPLEGAFGKEIKGIDLSRALTDEEARQVIMTFHENGLIVIRNQDLTLKQFERAAEMFGAIKPHFLDHLRLDGHPGILLLSNIVKEGRPIGVYRGAAFWHTDVAYQDPPNSATVVFGIQRPTDGCPTFFADTYTAYDDLSDSMKDKIKDLMVIHHYGNRDDMDENSEHSAEKLTDEQKKHIESVYHPLVKAHPVTGRKALYGVAGSSFGIVGMPEDEAIDLLDELKKHALQPTYQTVLDFEKGEFAAWDAFCTLHKATAQHEATGPRNSRLLWRASMVGMSPVLQN